MQTAARSAKLACSWTWWQVDAPLARTCHHVTESAGVPLITNQSYESLARSSTDTWNQLALLLWRSEGSVHGDCLRLPENAMGLHCLHPRWETERRIYRLACSGCSAMSVRKDDEPNHHSVHAFNTSQTPAVGKTHNWIAISFCTGTCRMHWHIQCSV